MQKAIIDEQYVRQISSRLDRFRQVNAHKFNCRCPVCGDSRKSSTKARFYIYSHSSGDGLVVKCHNCEYTSSFDKFLQMFDEALHREYVLDLVRSKNEWDQPKANDVESLVEKNVAPKIDQHKYLTKISKLPITHQARKYLDGRMIPPSAHYRIFYTSKFKRWAEHVLPGSYTSKQLQTDYEAIILPMYDKNGTIVHAQGKPLVDNFAIKYITVSIDKFAPRIFGLEQIDTNSTVYVVEGPFDSTFLDNCVASCGGEITADLALTSIEKSNIVIVYDNENRNLDTINKIRSAIENGYTVSLWPSEIPYKDINDMAMAGFSKAAITNIIDSHTCRGPEALVKLTFWSRV